MNKVDPFSDSVLQSLPREASRIVDCIERYYEYFDEEGNAEFDGVGAEKRKHAREVLRDLIDDIRVEVQR